MPIRLSRVPYLSNPASVNGEARGARELLQPLSQPDSGRQHHLNFKDNDNGDYLCSKRLHNEMVLTLTRQSPVCLESLKLPSALITD